MMVGTERLDPGGKTCREVGGPLVPGSWERGKVPRKPWLENLGRKEKAPVMAVSEQVG